VTGATGFIGRALCQRLLAQGFAVKALVRKPELAVDLQQAGVELVNGSLSDIQSLQQLVSNSHAIIHCAGAVRGGCQQDFDRVNVDGLRLLIQALQTHNPAARLLVLSSLAASQAQLSFYGTSKFRGEQLLQQHAGELAWTILRPPAVYGPGDKELQPLFKLAAKGLLLVPGAIDSRISIIHVDDLVSAMLAWLQSAETPAEIFTIDDGHTDGYNWREIAAQVTAITRRRVRLLAIPAFVLDTFARCNRGLARLIGYAPMLTPEKLRELRHPNWVCGKEAFSQRFGWQPQLDLQQGLEQTPGWR
jgi:nucleoside-diphosphate-sugar epimerase